MEQSLHLCHHFVDFECDVWASVHRFEYLCDWEKNRDAQCFDVREALHRFVMYYIEWWQHEANKPKLWAGSILRNAWQESDEFNTTVTSVHKKDYGQLMVSLA